MYCDGQTVKHPKRNLCKNESSKTMFESFNGVVMLQNDMLKLSVDGTHDLADFTSTLSSCPRDNRSGMSSKVDRQDDFAPAPPRLSGQTQGKKQLPPRCKVQAACGGVACVECGL